MNFQMRSCLLIFLFCAGCKIPHGDICSVTTSGVGFKFGYNSATQLPEVYLGFFRQTVQVVPTNSPPVTSSISVEQNGLHSAIFEEFSTSNASIPTNSVARIRAMRYAAPKEK